MFAEQVSAWAFAFALLMAGTSRDVSAPMMAIVASSSTKVNPLAGLSGTFRTNLEELFLAQETGMNIYRTKRAYF